MMKNLIFIFCSFILIKSSWTLAEGGSLGTRGGGSGVVCFSTIQQAEYFHDQILTGKMTSDFYEQIDVLLSLEHAEQHNMEDKRDFSKESQPHSYKHPDEKNRKTSLDELQSFLMKSIKRLSPILSFRLEQIKAVGDISSWIQKTELPLIEDANPSGGLPPNCRRIQIIHRLSSGNNSFGNGPIFQTPQVQIEYNQKLFSLLSPLDQLALILHEQLYTLSQSEGAMNSDRVRKFVRLLLFEINNWTRSNQWGEAQGHFIIRKFLVALYGDYPLFFADAIGSESHNPYFKAWIHFLKKNRNKVKQCLAGSASAEISPEDKCREKILNPALNAETMTEEEAFIHSVFFGLDKGMQLVHSELIFSPFDEDADASILQPRLYNACHLIGEIFNTEIKEIKIYVLKAQNYCKSILNDFKTDKSK